MGSTPIVPPQTYGSSGGGGGAINGTIASPQVAFGTAANTIGGSNDLVWDNTNKRLGIKTSSPTAALHVSGDVKFDKRITVATDYIVLSDDYQIDCAPVPPVAINVLIPLASSVGYGKQYIISDVVGFVSAMNTLTLTMSGGDTIHGVGSLSFTAPWVSITIRSQGASNSWKII